jgi:hypothetical protein
MLNIAKHSRGKLLNSQFLKEKFSRKAERIHSNQPNLNYAHIVIVILAHHITFPRLPALEHLDAPHILS